MKPIKKKIHWKQSSANTLRPLQTNAALAAPRIYGYVDGRSHHHYVILQLSRTRFRLALSLADRGTYPSLRAAKIAAESDDDFAFRRRFEYHLGYQHAVRDYKNKWKQKLARSRRPLPRYFTSPSPGAVLVEALENRARA